MATREEWNVLFTNVIPVVGVCVSAVGVTLGFLALLRSQSQAAGISGREQMPLSSGLAVKVPKVHYQDGDLFIEVRNPGEWHNIREFVQPANPDVIRMARIISYG